MRNLKQILHTIIDIILLYISGLACSYGFLIGVGFIFSILLNWLCKIFLPSPVTPHAYDDFIGGLGTLFCIFVCIPVGGVLGISGIDRFVFKSRMIFPWKVTVGFLLGVVGAMLVYWCLFPILGSRTFGIFPNFEHITFGYELFFVISVFFTLVGYKTVNLFRGRHNVKTL